MIFFISFGRSGGKDTLLASTSSLALPTCRSRQADNLYTLQLNYRPGKALEQQPLSELMRYVPTDSNRFCHCIKHLVSHVTSSAGMSHGSYTFKRVFICDTLVNWKGSFAVHLRMLLFQIEKILLCNLNKFRRTGSLLDKKIRIKKMTFH
jgi:hypothetical protein